MKIFIGIDPGNRGGIARIEQTAGRWLTTAHKMPSTETDTVELLRELVRTPDEQVRVACEKLGPVPPKMRGSISNFKLGLSYGFLRGCLAAIGVRREFILPRTWQKEFGLVFPKAKNLTDTEKKNLHKAAAQELFPQIKITHAIADALLIAEFLRRREHAEAAGGR